MDLEKRVIYIKIWFFCIIIPVMIYIVFISCNFSEVYVGITWTFYFTLLLIQSDSEEKLKKERKEKVNRLISEIEREKNKEIRELEKEIKKRDDEIKDLKIRG